MMEEFSILQRPNRRDHWTRPYRRKRSLPPRSYLSRSRYASSRTSRSIRCSKRSPCVSCQRKAFFSSLHRARMVIHSRSTTFGIIRALRKAAQRSKRNSDQSRSLEDSITANRLSSRPSIVNRIKAVPPKEAKTHTTIHGGTQSQIVKSPLLNGILGSSNTIAIGMDSSKSPILPNDNKPVSRKRAMSPVADESQAAKIARTSKNAQPQRHGDGMKAPSKVTNNVGRAVPAGNAQPQAQKEASITGGGKGPETAKPQPNGITKSESTKKLSQQSKAAGQKRSEDGSVKGKMDVVSTKLSKWPLSMKGPRRQGLDNPGAWCYRRAMLQCFLSTPQFYNVVTHRQNSNCSPQCVPCALRTFTESYHRDGSQARLNLKKLDQSTRMQPGKNCPRWSSNGVHNQEDAHEYMLYLLNSLDATKCIHKAALEKSFRIAHRASWTCQKCHRTHTHDDPAGWSISLPITPGGGGNNTTTTLAACMNQYHAASRLKIRCDACKTDGPRLRGSAIRMLPEVLIVHLLRFGMSFGLGGRRGAVRKNTAKVSVPEVLDVKPWVVEGVERTRYRLSSMLYHTGGLNSGHYVARVRSAAGVDLMDDSSRPQRMRGWNDEAGSFTPYVLVFQRE